MDHLHVVTRASLADPVTARLAVDLGSSSLEDLLDVRPCSGGTTRHEGGTVTGTLLTTGHTGTDEQEALRLKLLAATNTVRVVRVTAVNDDVTRLEVGDKLLDEGIDGSTSLDEKDDLAGTLELGGELLDRVSTLDVRTYATRSQLREARGA